MINELRDYVPGARRGVEPRGGTAAQTRFGLATRISFEMIRPSVSTWYTYTSPVPMSRPGIASSAMLSRCLISVVLVLVATSTWDLYDDLNTFHRFRAV